MAPEGRVRMKLIPIRPPGPNARKARVFAEEMRALRAQGYTFEAIREALAAAGVHVSNSTVQREVARMMTPKAAASVVGGTGRWRASPLPEPAAPEPPAAVQDSSPVAVRRGGKEIAEAFMSSRVHNPLVRAKVQR